MPYQITVELRITSYNVCYTKLLRAKFPFVLAFPFAIIISALIGYMLFKLISMSSNSSVTSLIILTLGYSIFVRGASQVVFDKQMHTS